MPVRASSAKVPVQRAFFVGEQPGDREDREGRPFLGPAGRVLDEALETAGIDRTDVYVINAVKHFNFTRWGKKRLHDKPNRGEIQACRAWLDAELHIVRLTIIVCPGATAAQALLGNRFRLTQHRGRFFREGHSPLTSWRRITPRPRSGCRTKDPTVRPENALLSSSADFRRS